MPCHKRPPPSPGPALRSLGTSTSALARRDRLTAAGLAAMRPTGTTDLRLTWRAAVCGLWVLCCVAAAAYLIWRHEGPRAHRRTGGDGDGKKPRRRRKRPVGVLYDDEAWRPCLGDIHPACLLLCRLCSFVALLSLIMTIVVCDRSRHIFESYTQWTLILGTVYFGLATALSTYGCSKFAGWNTVAAVKDTELGPYAVHGATGTKPTIQEEEEDRTGTSEIAGFWGYLLQIIYQTNAGAVMLTECLFWFIIVKDEGTNFLLIGMHSASVFLLLGEASLNSLRFPWFRIAYFFLWTALYIVFQWIVHAATPIWWWPYPFLDPSANQAPLWYFVVAFMQLPCYVVFRLLMNLKHNLLSKHFPESTVVRD